MSSYAYIRVKRGKGFDSIMLEDLSEGERTSLLQSKGTDELIRWINMLCDALKDNEGTVE